MQRIAIGGGEANRPVLESIPFDITVYRLARNSPTEPTRTYDTNVRVVTNFNLLTDHLLLAKLKGIPVAGSNARLGPDTEQLLQNARNRLNDRFDNRGR